VGGQLGQGGTITEPLLPLAPLLPLPLAAAPLDELDERLDPAPPSSPGSTRPPHARDAHTNTAAKARPRERSLLTP
jgi:hypothetical protein